MAPDAGPLAGPGCAGRRRVLLTGQAAGRHRVPPRGRQRRPPSLLLMDYPAGDGPLAGYQVRTFAPATGRRPGVRSVGRDVALAVALACLAAAVLVGIALSHAPGVAAAPGNAAPGNAAPGNAAPGLPQPGSLLPQPGATSPSPVTSPDRDRRRAGPGRRTATTRAQPKQVSQARPSAAARRPAARPPAVVVRYLVISRGPAGFQGEIQVTNNTAQPIWNWQIVVTLYDDAVTSFTNADGFFSNGILLLSPASPAQVAPPDGGVLDVFFTADGFQTTPAACAFDGTDCGY